MNPNVQAQIYDLTGSKFDQSDGGSLSQNAILFQILVEMRIFNYYMAAMASGQSPKDETASLRADALADPNFVQFK